MFIFFVLFLLFYSLYFYLSYQVILLSDLEQIFSQTASKAQEDLKQYSDLVLEDLSKCYQHILLIILFITAICFLWILLLKYNAKLIIWLSIFSLPILLSIGLYYSIATYISLHNSNNNPLDDELLYANEQSLAFDRALQTILTAELMSYVKNDTLWLIISILLLIILTILIVILHSLRARVGLSIALIRQASKAINGVKSTLLFPILPRTLAIGVLGYGILIGLLIISASQTTFRYENGQPCRPRFIKQTNRNQTALGNVRKNPQASNSNDPSRIPSRVLFEGQDSPLDPPNARPIQDLSGRASVALGVVSNINRNNSFVRDPDPSACKARQTLSRQHVWKYHALNVFAILWLVHFLSGVSQTTLAGAFASYYWAFRKPQDVPFFAVTASLFRVLKNHLGDIAFGSFLIATIRYIRIVIEFIDRRIRNKTTPGSVDQTARSATCFLRVFFWLLDRFLKYIDRNAYIMMSMYGEGYLRSAKRAIELLYKNTTRALVLDYVTYFVLLISRILITAFAGFITAQERFTGDLHYKWLPIVLVVIGTYFISKGLFSVYSMAVDTLFICFLIDSTNNDGSAERPYFMPKEMRKILKRNTVIS